MYILLLKYPSSCLVLSYVSIMPRHVVFTVKTKTIFQTFRSSSANLEVMQQIDAKYPALLFKQQLTAYVEKIYGIVRDNLKKELATPLASCIQVQLVFKTTK